MITLTVKDAQKNVEEHRNNGPCYKVDERLSKIKECLVLMPRENELKVDINMTKYHLRLEHRFTF